MLSSIPYTNYMFFSTLAGSNGGCEAFYLRVCCDDFRETTSFGGLPCLVAYNRGAAPGQVKVLFKALCIAPDGVIGAPRRGERTCQQHLAGASSLSISCCFINGFQQAQESRFMKAPWPAEAFQGSTTMEDSCTQQPTAGESKREQQTAAASSPSPVPPSHRSAQILPRRYFPRASPSPAPTTLAMGDEACDEAGASLLWHEGEPEWAQVAGMASDLVVTIGQRAFHVHQYPLYALLAFHVHQYPLFSLSTVIANAAAASGEGTGPMQADLSFLPGGALSFIPIACYCYGRPCRLSPHSVLLVRSAGTDAFSLQLMLFLSALLIFPLLNPPVFSLSLPGSVSAGDERVWAQPRTAAAFEAPQQPPPSPPSPFAPFPFRPLPLAASLLEMNACGPSHSLPLPQLASQRLQHFLQHWPHCLHVLSSYV
ncbi:unnamed protein product [Closterium sp. Yama58-4]|nr:unnamed protein product [Closterium sp. Yama58-4]